MNPKTSVFSSTCHADKNPIGNGSPICALTVAIEALLVLRIVEQDVKCLVSCVLHFFEILLHTLHKFF
jgi:hypothetical protein